MSVLVLPFVVTAGFLAVTCLLWVGPLSKQRQELSLEERRSLQRYSLRTAAGTEYLRSVLEHGPILYRAQVTIQRHLREYLHEANLLRQEQALVGVEREIVHPCNAPLSSPMGN